jgi:F-type H+-transporting ATPase subunit b
VEAEKIIVSAKEQINNEKMKAMIELKNQVADISIDMAEKILKSELKDVEKQKNLISEALKKQMN